MIGAIVLGLFCGIVARMLVPGDAFRAMSGWKSWLVQVRRLSATGEWK